MEALRCRKRRLSDVVYRRLVADTGPGGRARTGPNAQRCGVADEPGSTSSWTHPAAFSAAMVGGAGDGRPRL
jgi:hypothetical protein